MGAHLNKFNLLKYKMSGLIRGLNQYATMYWDNNLKPCCVTSHEIGEECVIYHRDINCRSLNWMRQYGDLKNVLADHIIDDVAKLCLDYIEFIGVPDDMGLYDKYRPKSICCTDSSGERVWAGKFAYSPNIKFIHVD